MGREDADALECGARHSFLQPLAFLAPPASHAARAALHHSKQTQRPTPPRPRWQDPEIRFGDEEHTLADVLRRKYGFEITELPDELVDEEEWMGEEGNEEWGEEDSHTARLRTRPAVLSCAGSW